MLNVCMDGGDEDDATSPHWEAGLTGCWGAPGSSFAMARMEQVEWRPERNKNGLLHSVTCNGRLLSLKRFCEKWKNTLSLSLLLQVMGILCKTFLSGIRDCESFCLGAKRSTLWSRMTKWAEAVTALSLRWKNLYANEILSCFRKDFPS